MATMVIPIRPQAIITKRSYLPQLMKRVSNISSETMTTIETVAIRSSGETFHASQATGGLTVIAISSDLRPKET